MADYGAPSYADVIVDVKLRKAAKGCEIDLERLQRVMKEELEAMRDEGHPDAKWWPSNIYTASDRAIAKLGLGSDEE